MKGDRGKTRSWTVLGLRVCFEPPRVGRKDWCCRGDGSVECAGEKNGGRRRAGDSPGKTGMRLAGVGERKAKMGGGHILRRAEEAALHKKKIQSCKWANPLV